MSDKYNAELVKNPKWFAKSHVMSCAAAIEYGLKVHDHYLSVPSDKRVCYWNVEEETEDPLDKICNVRISSKYLPGYRTGYYLPYKSNSVIKCTLKDKRTTKLKLVDEPEAFFTFIIDGCSIIFEGDPEEPTVYHANNSSPPRSIRDKTAQRQFVAQDLTQKWTMTKLPKMAQQILDQEQKAETVQFRGQALHATEYLKDEAIYVQKYQDHFYIVKVYGMVFGVRHKKSWKFYLQKNLKRIGPQGRTYQVLSVSQIWPGSGMASVVLRPPYFTDVGFRNYLEDQGNQAIGNLRVFNDTTFDHML